MDYICTDCSTKNLLLENAMRIVEQECWSCLLTYFHYYTNDNWEPWHSTGRSKRGWGDIMQNITKNGSASITDAVSHTSGTSSSTSSTNSVICFLRVLTRKAFSQLARANTTWTHSPPQKLLSSRIISFTLGFKQATTNETIRTLQRDDAWQKETRD